MGNYNFDQDLSVEMQTKGRVCEYLKSIGWTILHDSDTKYYDLVAEKDGKEYKIEIKEDFYCYKSGNIAVEFECRGSSSGIAVTLADLYFYVIHYAIDKELYHVTTVKKLKKSIANAGYTRIVKGGDVGSNTMMYLYPLATYKALGKVIFDEADVIVEKSSLDMF